jgi:hypothetical protein
MLQLSRRKLTMVAHVDGVYKENLFECGELVSPVISDILHYSHGTGTLQTFKQKQKGKFMNVNSLNIL